MRATQWFISIRGKENDDNNNQQRGPCILPLRVESARGSVVSNSLGPHGLWSARLLCPWNPPGKNMVWVVWGSSSSPGDPPLPQGILLTRLSCTAGRFFTVWATRHYSKRVMKDGSSQVEQKGRERQGCARNPSLAFSPCEDCHGDGRLVAWPLCLLMKMLEGAQTKHWWEIFALGCDTPLFLTEEWRNIRNTPWPRVSQTLVTYHCHHFCSMQVTALFVLLWYFSINTSTCFDLILELNTKGSVYK